MKNNTRHTRPGSQGNATRTEEDKVKDPTPLTELTNRSSITAGKKKQAPITNLSNHIPTKTQI